MDCPRLEESKANAILLPRPLASSSKYASMHVGNIHAREKKA
jgi:hypothetical protein